MNLSDVFYIFIPITNSFGNVALKVSLNANKEGKKRKFILMQVIGYSVFILVVFFSYLFLLSHAASHFVVILASNYIFTMYVSRLYFKEAFYIKDIFYDIMLVIGIVIFFSANNIKFM